MSKPKGKKPTNKERDRALSIHDNALRELVPKFNELFTQVQDFFAIFSMFVEFLGKDDEFGKFVQKRVKEINKEKEANAPKIVGPDGSELKKDPIKDAVAKSTETTIPVDKVVAEDA